MKIWLLAFLAFIVLFACSRSSDPNDDPTVSLHTPVITYATQTGNTEIVICLDFAYPEGTEFLFEKKTAEDFTSFNPNRLTPYTFSDTIELSENDQSISYRLRVKQNDLFSEYSNVMTCNYHSGYILAPGFLSLKLQELNQLKLSWQNNSSVATAIILERSRNGADFVPVQTLQPTVTSTFDQITDTGTYSYRVKAVKDNISSTYSNTVSSEFNSLFPLTGLIAYYPFNGNANDASGGRHHGTVHGAVLATDRFGNINQAFDFDGIDDFIEIAATGNLEPQFSYITLSGWFNAREWFQFGDYGGWGALMHHGFSSSSPFCFQVKGYPGTLSPNVGIYFGNSYRSYYDYSNFDLNRWYHVAVVLSPGSIRFFVNGNPTHEENYYLTLPASSEPYYIGKDPPEATLDYHIGRLDDLCIYNRALTDAEIQALYAYGNYSGVGE